MDLAKKWDEEYPGDISWKDVVEFIEGAGFVLVPKAKPETLAGFLHAGGGLYNGGQYICWQPGEPDICLDDRFTIEELEAFTQHVRAARPKVTP